jgi:putative OPT family oligopeptide transporter
VMFGMVNAYAGLKIGLTVSASIPAAILSMSVLRGLLGRPPPRWMGGAGRFLFAKATVLENNTAHAVASTGESLAGGVIFTMPALIFLAKGQGVAGPSQLLMFLLGLSGGFLGLLLMIPLRRYLMVEQHDELPFPEGTACAKVLIAGDRGGKSAIPVVIGGLLGGVYNTATDLLTALRDTVTFTAKSLHQATLSFQLNPLTLGVGYLIGFRNTLVLFLGGVVGWVLLIPFFDWLGVAVGPTSELVRHWLAYVPLEGPPSPDAIWSHYVRYVGAGGVAVGGFMSLARSLPAIASSFASGVKGFKGEGPKISERPRTDRDLPSWVVIAGVALISLALWLLPPFQLSWIEALLAVIFSFFFVVVASRMVGVIGTTSQPISGMTIAALLCTAFILSHVRGTSYPVMFAAMTVGVVVCIAISLAGDLSQDLKTCTLVGGTPWVVQSGQMVGTLSAALRAGWVLWLLDTRYHLGSMALPAPQATLMATLVKGAFGGHLPWGLLALGGAIALLAEGAKLGGLSFSIGLYLPVATSASFIFGGLIQLLLKRRQKPESYPHADETATLLSSGMVAGYALMGIAVAFIGVAAGEAETHAWLSPIAWVQDHAALRHLGDNGFEDALTIVPFAAMAAYLWRRSNRGPQPV